MRNYSVSPQAREDLIEIWQFISQDSVEAADNLLDSFVEKFELIADRPQAGCARPELARNLRSFPVGRYVIFYRLSRNVVEIVRVLHGARDIYAVFPNPQ
jgi:toxin ParE1/3/4